MPLLDPFIAALEKGYHPAPDALAINNPTVLSRENKRILDLARQFRTDFPHDEIDIFSVPGRTEIGGNHTDHNHGRVLAGAVSLDNIAVAAGNGTDRIWIHSKGYADFTVDLNNLEPDRAEKYTSAAIARGICFRMKELGFHTGGFDACIDGGVPKGSGLSSSAAFEVLIGTILNHLFNEGKMDPVRIAQIGQYSENHYFGKPCGLMDQVACAVGGLVTIDFKDPSEPLVKMVNFDFSKTGYSIVITDTGGNHADLNEEYASLPKEMRSVASELGHPVMRDVSPGELMEALPGLREKTGDRAILRAMHFLGDNQRVADQVSALENGDFRSFLAMVIESGQSSFMYNQNIYPSHNVWEQGVSLGLALSEGVLKGKGAWRVHGGGFAGTIQAFVPEELLDGYVKTLEHTFGEGSCYILSIREMGAMKLEI